MSKENKENTNSMTTITKFRLEGKTEQGLLDSCKTEEIKTDERLHQNNILTMLQIGDCESITWTNPEKGTRIYPPVHTLAVVVDLTDGQGALRFFELETDKFVDMVGMEDAGKQVLVQWSKQWWLRISGQLRIGYIVGKHEK